MRCHTIIRGAAASDAAQLLDIDPFCLPVRYTVPFGGAVGQYFHGRDEILLGRRSVYVRRIVLGVTIHAARYPISSFEGVGLFFVAHEGGQGDRKVCISLRHKDEQLCLPLFMDFGVEVAGARWAAFGRVLGLPLMVPSEDGSWIRPFEKANIEGVYKPIQRAPRLSLASRRARITTFRPVGHSAKLTQFDGAEIIARD